MLPSFLMLSRLLGQGRLCLLVLFFLAFQGQESQATPLGAPALPVILCFDPSLELSNSGSRSAHYGERLHRFSQWRLHDTQVLACTCCSQASDAIRIGHCGEIEGVPEGRERVQILIFPGLPAIDHITSILIVDLFLCLLKQSMSS